MELSGFVALTYGLHIYRDGYEGVAWDSHEFKVMHVTNQFTIGMIPVGQRSIFYWYGHLAACVCVCVCVPSMGLEDVIDRIEALPTFISFK